MGPCPVCGTKVGQLHEGGFGDCKREDCPYCGLSPWSYGCTDRQAPMDDRMPWRGATSLEAAAVEHGWWARLEGRVWRECDEWAPGAVPNLLQAMARCVWDREAKRFVLKNQSP